MRESLKMQRVINSKKSTRDLFQFYALRWLEEAKLGLKDSSVAKYRNIVSLYLIPAFGKKRLCDFNRNKIDSFTSKLLTKGGRLRKGLQPSTVNTILTVLKEILDFASQNTGVPRVGFRKLRVNARKISSRVLRASDQKTLWNYLRDDSRQSSLGIFLCLTYGLRIGEICALRWGDVDLRDGMISVNRTLTRRQTFSKKGRKTEISISSLKSVFSERKIPLAPRDVEFLSQRRRPNDAYVLTGSPLRYMEPRTLANRFKKILHECDIPDVTFHSLRHSFATRWVKLGYGVKIFSEILGHSSVNVTLNYYVHPSTESQRQSVSRFSNDLFSK